MSSDLFYPSILNDVLSPVIQGPSSSNTAGPYRIGRIARDLLNGRVRKVSVEMSTRGDFAEMFYSMGSDKALLLGLMKKDLILDGLDQAYGYAEENGLRFHFLFTDSVPDYPSELMQIRVSSDNETLYMEGVSLGGGEVIIRKVNGRETAIKGMRDEDVILPGGNQIRTVHSVYPFRRRENPEPPFRTSREWIEYEKLHSDYPWESAMKYEKTVTGLDEVEIEAACESVWKISMKAMESGYREGITFDGVVKPKAASIRNIFHNKRLIPIGIGERGMVDALAVMEYSNSHGIVVCMPTGGCCGIIPAAIENAAESMGMGDKEKRDALLTAGLIGVFCYPTHYHGALGCQAEVGIATAMAAGGLASMIGADVETVERAAVIALQYLLGQLCDPVDGYTQVPCIVRNMLSVSVAASCANAAVMGIETLVGLDDMVDTVIRTGEKVHEINQLGTCACRKNNSDSAH